MKKILVVAAHPDDEILGCGATIAKLKQNNTEVRVILGTAGITSRDGLEELEKRKQLDELSKIALEANKVLGVDKVYLENFPDNSMDSIPRLQITQRLEKIISEYQPDTVFTHHFGDLNVDHRRIQEAVLTACRPQPHTSVKEIFLFEVPSSTGWFNQTPAFAFIPNCYIDVSADLKKKIKALEIYKSEMRQYPHARSLEGVEFLAKWRGCEVGVEAAEAFFQCRRII